VSLAELAGAVAGGLLVLAGILKLASPLWPEQARRLGAPRWAVPVVPWLEVVLGALLAAGVARPWSALAAVALLLVFSGLLALRLVQKRPAPCACFGRLSGRPVTWWSVVRNLALIGLALWSLAA
jgi:hypothetical protein